MGVDEMQQKTVKIYIMGKEYEVPAGITIMKAVEYAGYQYIRGAGCRGGFCGACATLYRIRGDYRLYTALACQTTVQDGMYIVQIPFAPAEKVKYNIEGLKPTGTAVLALYPEIARCVACNACTKACPQELEVMNAIQMIKRGDIAKAAELSFDCISCGLCSIRCPAEIIHYHVFQLIRRLYGKYILPKAKHLEVRVKEIENGKFNEELNKLCKMSFIELKKLYDSRDIESPEG
ncbi:MAG: 4Fe-4S dicluster domain-containing protein [Candidatus Methanomethylicia archaeon]|nr:4Fe-4S dicluster domain-containing protein [Candidatus Methanomethylicia archaeon]